MNIPNRQNSEEHKIIFENAHKRIFQASMDGSFLKDNPAMARISGHESPNDMVKFVTNISKHFIDAVGQLSLYWVLLNKTPSHRSSSEHR